MNLGKLVQSKTFWLGIGTIAASIVSFQMKAITLDKMVAGVIGGLALIFTRQAIEKSGVNGGAK